MAFGKKKSDDSDDESSGRYVVEHVPVMVSGKRFLQQALNKGEANGYELKSLLMSDKHDWILVVWERPHTASGSGTS